MVLRLPGKLHATSKNKIAAGCEPAATESAAEDLRLSDYLLLLHFDRHGFSRAHGDLISLLEIAKILHLSSNIDCCVEPSGARNFNVRPF